MVHLTLTQIFEILLSSNNPMHYCVGGRVDFINKQIILVLGNLAHILTIDFDYFEPSGDGIEPDFYRFGIVDHGQTLRLGKYQACVRTIVEEKLNE